MIKYLNQYRFYIVLFLFILIPVIAIDTSGRSPREYRFYDRVIVGVTAPLQSMISWSLENLAYIYENYVYLWHTRQNDLVLLEENRKLLGLIAGLRESQQENLRLRRLLDFEEKFSLQSVVARVVAKDVSTDFRSIRLNRGETSGIQKNMAVLTSEGIVGRILRTTQTTSDVVTIVDLLSAVDAIVERSRARGVVEGMTDELCQLRYTLRTDDIQVGDVLISNGLGGIFPRGVMVGTVSAVHRKPYGITQEVEVKPSVDFSKLEEVLVVTNIDESGEIIPSKNNKNNLMPAQVIKPNRSVPLKKPLVDSKANLRSKPNKTKSKSARSAPTVESDLGQSSPESGNAKSHQTSTQGAQE